MIPMLRKDLAIINASPLASIKVLHSHLRALDAPAGLRGDATAQPKWLHKG